MAAVAASIVLDERGLTIPAVRLRVSVVVVESSGQQLCSRAWQNVDGCSTPLEFVAYLDQLDEVTRAARMETAILLGIVPGRSALDVGCGTGSLAIELAMKVGPTGRVVGVDLSEMMIATARARADARGIAAEFFVGDTYALDLPTDSFDAVHCDRVLQHLDDPLTAIREMTRVLVPGGTIVIREPDWDGLFIDGGDAATTRAVRDALVDGIRQPRVGRTLRRLVLTAGLDVIDFQGAVGVYAVSRSAADAVWNVRAQLDRAVETGAVDDESARAWWNDLGDLDDAGQFFAGVVGFRVVGRKSA